MILTGRAGAHLDKRDSVCLRFSVDMGEARQYFQWPGVFEMHRGGSILNPTIAYETWGELNSDHDNAVLIFNP